MKINNAWRANCAMNGLAAYSAQKQIGPDEETVETVLGDLLNFEAEIDEESAEGGFETDDAGNYSLKT